MQRQVYIVPKAILTAANLPRGCKIIQKLQVVSYVLSVWVVASSVGLKILLWGDKVQPCKDQ